MKRIICLIAALAVAAFMFAAPTKAQAAVTTIDKNTALIVTACEKGGENGFAAVAGEGREISFDMLKSADNGTTGIITAADKKNVSKAGNLTEYSFENGYNYRLTLTGEKVIISKRGFFENVYEKVDEKSVSAGGILGIYALSDGVLSASFIIDDFMCFDENGNETVVDKFDKKTAEKGSVIKSFDCNGFIDIYDDITYDVSFLTEEGDLIAVETVCKYNHVNFPSAPEKEGFRFVRWTGDTENITSDGACYAVYEEGEEPSSDIDISGKDSVDGSHTSGDNGSSKGGCGSSVTGVSAISLAIISAAVVMKRRKGDE